MAEALSKSQRKKIEEYVINFFDILDKSGTNSNYYKNIFSEMDDAQFMKFISKKYPFRFQLRQSVTEPTMSDIEDACDYTGVPLLEHVYLPYYYTNKDGTPLRTAKCLVGYQHHKKEQQFVTKKTKWATEIANRDMKSGRLIGHDKGTGMSDREFESMSALGLDNCTYEFARPRADSMKAKTAMTAAINTKGFVTQDDIPNESDDSLSKNLIDVYMMSALLETNLINEDGYTAYTLKNKKRSIERK